MSGTLRGSLILVPNTLDAGTPGEPPDLRDVLPLGVLQTAARLGHWVVENAKTTRAFLKRVDAVVPLARPIQAIDIVVLPRAPKGGAKSLGAAAGDDPGTVPGPFHGRGSSGSSPGSVSASRPDSLLSPALRGEDLGLISEAGLPAVADPGARLVQAAHAAGIAVVALPGPSSLLLALAASGLNGQSFAFVGYLPTDTAERGTRIRALEACSRQQRQTQLVIETPYRNAALLGALIAHLGPGTRLSVSCGLTLAGGFTRSDTVRGWQATPTQLPADVPAVFALLAG